MKEKILTLLGASQAIISGQALSQQLGISRVAVWKHIRQLKAAGYGIEATAKGYQLIGQADTPYPWNFGPMAEKIHYYPQVNSTMNQAMTLAREGCPDFSVVVADVQTQGRGRLKRTWQSEAGGLYFSLVLRPGLSPAQAPLLNIAAAVDLARVLKQLFGIDARLKWPNDVLVVDQKIAGILSLMEAEAEQVNFVILGIGLNVNNSPASVDQPVTSIRDLTGGSTPRSAILKTFIETFQARLEKSFPGDTISQWRQLSATLGRPVKIRTTTEVHQGLAVEIEPSGALVLETAAGQRVPVVFGDCFHDE